MIIKKKTCAVYGVYGVRCYVVVFATKRRCFQSNITTTDGTYNYAYIHVMSIFSFRIRRLYAFVLGFWFIKWISSYLMREGFYNWISFSVSTLFFYSSLENGVFPRTLSVAYIVQCSKASWIYDPLDMSSVDISFRRFQPNVSCFLFSLPITMAKWFIYQNILPNLISDAIRQLTEHKQK